MLLCVACSGLLWFVCMYECMYVDVVLVLDLLLCSGLCVIQTGSASPIWHQIRSIGKHVTIFSLTILCIRI